MKMASANLSTAVFLYFTDRTTREMLERQRTKQWHSRKTAKIPMNLVWDLSALASDT